MIYIPVSWGELLDKISILQIKSERIADPAKLRNVSKELELLSKTRDESLAAPPVELVPLAAELKEVNEKLWDVENRVRDCDAKDDFGSGFVEQARSVYRLNDHRSALKRRINLLLGSVLIEEKEFSRK